MSKVTLPSILRSLRSATAAEVKAMYQAIADVLNGNVLGENFGHQLRIPNGMKAEPRSWMAMSGWKEAWSGAAGDDISFSIPQAALPGGDLKVGAWSAAALYASSAAAYPYAALEAGWLMGSEIHLEHRTGPDASPTLLDSAALASGAALPWYRLARMLEVEQAVEPGDIISVRPASLTFLPLGQRLIAVGVTIWLRTDHLP